MADGTYLVVAAAQWTDTALGWSYSSVVNAFHLDGVGDVLQHSHLNIPTWASYPGWCNSADRMSDGRVVVGGNTYGQDGSSRPALFILGEDGVVEQWWEYAATGQYWAGRQAKQTPDGGFVLCGETSSNGGNQNDAFVLKTDAQGEQQWVRTYGLPTKYEIFMSIDLAPNGGYYLGGRQSTTSLTNYDQWVVLVDPQGEVVWQENYGLTYNDPNAHLTGTSDGNSIWASGCAIDADQNWRPCLTKVSTNGQTIWSKEYGPGLYQTLLYVVQEVVPGGDLIAAGQSYVNNLISVGYIHGLLLRTTSTGDSLWMRYYDYYDDDLSNGRGYFRDVQPTSDGGFIAVGHALAGGPYGHDTWVVKTDQHGCIEPGCQLIMGVETQITNLRDALTVFPNPVASGGNVQVGIALPAGFTAQGQLRLTVVSSDGRVVHEQNVGQGVSTLNPFNLQPSTGMYRLHLSDATRWISGAKLVVE